MAKRRRLPARHGKIKRAIAARHRKPKGKIKLKSGRQVTLPQLRDMFEHMK